MRTIERIIDKLDLKEFQLKVLLDITKAINNNVTRTELLKLYGDIVHEQLGITRLLLFERVEGWKQVLSFGASAVEIDGDPDLLFGGYKEISVIGDDQARRPRTQKENP